MRKKIIISFLFIMMIFSIFVTSDVLAMDSLTQQVLNEMDTTKVGITMDGTFTTVVRTLYALIQITVVGGSLIYFTWHSAKFFSSDIQERTKAKEKLPYRVGALLVILGIDGLIAIVFKYFTPEA